PTPAPHPLSLHDALPIFPPLGPLPGRVPPYGGSSSSCGVLGGMIVIRPCGRSMRHDPVIASAINATCSAALAATPRVRRHPGGRDRKSTRLNSSHVSISY